MTRRPHVTVGVASRWVEREAEGSSPTSKGSSSQDDDTAVQSAAISEDVSTAVAYDREYEPVRALGYGSAAVAVLMKSRITGHLIVSKQVTWSFGHVAIWPHVIMWPSGRLEAGHVVILTKSCLVVIRCSLWKLRPILASQSEFRLSLNFDLNLR